MTKVKKKLAESGLNNRKNSQRKCIVTGISQCRDGLIRFVIDPFGQVTLDLAEKLPGKGIWITSCHKTISTAINKGLFSRTVRKSVVIPEGLIFHTESALVERVIATIGLARRSGSVIAGHEKVESALRQGKVSLRIEAKDGASHGRDKLSYLRPNIPVLSSAYSKELAKAFDRSHIVHIAFSNNNQCAGKGLEYRLKKDFGRLEYFRKTNADTGLENPVFGCIETN